jgi:hypothetical protein
MVNWKGYERKLSLPNFKSRTMILAEHAARVGKIINESKILVWKPEVKRPL